MLSVPSCAVKSMLALGSVAETRSAGCWQHSADARHRGHGLPIEVTINCCYLSKSIVQQSKIKSRGIPCNPLYFMDA